MVFIGHEMFTFSIFQVFCGSFMLLLYFICFLLFVVSFIIIVDAVVMYQLWLGFFFFAISSKFTLYIYLSKIISSCDKIQKKKI
jgi:hypothetical protein